MDSSTAQSTKQPVDKRSLAAKLTPRITASEVPDGAKEGILKDKPEMIQVTVIQVHEPIPNKDVCVFLSFVQCISLSSSLIFLFFFPLFSSSFFILHFFFFFFSSSFFFI